MRRTSFTEYDEYPEAMLIYLRNYGPHFNRRLCEFAVSKMTKKRGGVDAPIKAMSKEEVENLLHTYKIKLINDQLYDSTYVANMCKADFIGSSIEDELHLVKYIKDVIDDEDAYDGIVFNRWYADMSYLGIAIDWESMLG